ncbi:hypothetical protein PMPD1_3048 [Paramixta manurensis]|uniref:Uncharacterized protein n=1 Tax=Paramixta manurensis TaxID=2740817 RepID=A0A6M8UGE6_9GAMM|nr:hypothetical protein PMPD1_3048 [Erwiniaceae bacterium PD-1]
MNQDEGLTVALSPVQMTAILRRKNVSSGETMSNRLWGGLGVIGGVVEIFGAGILCIVPEPTMITKAGCVVVGAHSLDTLNTAFQQVLTGRKTDTATARLAEIAAAKSEVLSMKRLQLENALKYMQPGSRIRLDQRFYFSTGRYVDKGNPMVKKLTQ